MRKKDHVPFSQKFPSADPLGLKLLEKLLAFDPKDHPTTEEVVLCCCLKQKVRSLCNTLFEKTGVMLSDLLFADIEPLCLSQWASLARLYWAERQLWALFA